MKSSNLKKILIIFLMLWNAYAYGASLDLIDELKSKHPDLCERFQGSAFVPENLTVEEHTRLVIERFKQNESRIILPSCISRDDFLLFLALHDIGKHQSKTEEMIFPTETNRKDLELFYSRCIFKTIAQLNGMDERAIQSLFCLLRHDVIGDYLKGFHLVEVAYQLIIEESTHAGLPILDFLNLHFLFHRLDAGSYSGLRGIFQEDRWQYSGSALEREQELYEFYSHINSDSTRPYKAKTWFRLAPQGREAWLDYQSSFKHFFNTCPQTIKAIHASSSGVLVGLMKTATTLYPSGYLKKLEITPFSGILEIGATETGINASRLSGNALGKVSNSLSYAHYAPTADFIEPLF